MSKKHFLALTALEDFWDTTKPMLFLGEWCLKHDRRSVWEPLHGEVMDSPFGSAEEADKAYQHVNELYERILPIIANELNSIHEVNHSLRYWRILLGPWLIFYLPAIYDRYEHIKCVLEKYPDLVTTVLSEQSFVVPKDSLEFVCSVFDDSINLQIFSKILSSFGREFPKQGFLVEQSVLHEKLTERSWTQRLLGMVTVLHTSIFSKFFPALIVFKNSYFPKSAEINMLIRLFGRGASIRGLDTKIPEYQYDAKLREGLKDISFGEDGFLKCLSAMLYSDIPKCFMEGYKPIHEMEKKQYPSFVKCIFSANAWWYDEVFKFWAARNAEKGTVLLGTPHSGATSGARRNLHSVKHETAIVDYYYSWGWERDDCYANVIPMPATALMGRKKIGASNEKHGILWGTTSNSRYLFQFSYLPPLLFKEYLYWHELFAFALSKELIPKVRVRAHFQDNGWSIFSKLNEKVPELKLDAWDVPFLDSLDHCRLYVCDHLSTTFAESLASNKPTILFWNPINNKLRAEAEPYFDLLRDNEILFDSPEEAAIAVNNIYGDVETWWNNPQRQEALHTFRKQYCRMSPDSITLWTKEFHRVFNEK